MEYNSCFLNNKVESFRKFIEQNTVGTHNDYASGSYLPSDFTGSEVPIKYDGRPGFLPSVDLQLPSTNKTAMIRFIDMKRNPISIFLTDGTRLYLTIHQFKRIKGTEPAVGKTLSVTFQRSPEDHSEQPSQIASITCY